MNPTQIVEAVLFASEAPLTAEESARAADAEGETAEGAVFGGRIRPAAGALRLRAAR